MEKLQKVIRHFFTAPPGCNATFRTSDRSEAGVIWEDGKAVLAICSYIMPIPLMTYDPETDLLRVLPPLRSPLYTKKIVAFEKRLYAALYAYMGENMPGALEGLPSLAGLPDACAGEVFTISLNPYASQKLDALSDTIL